MSRVFQILFLDCSLPIRKNIIDFCLFILCPATLLYYYIKQGFFVCEFLRIFYIQYHVICKYRQFLLIVSQFSSVAQSCPTLRPHGLQHARVLGHHQLPELVKLMSIESVTPSSQLILCHSLLLLPSVFPSIRVSSSESVLCIRWPKYWSFSISSFN